MKKLSDGTGDILFELQILCVKLGYSFVFKKEGETNCLTLNRTDKSLVVNLPNIEDESLNELLLNQVAALKDLLE
jgi:hypothetical protein